MFAELRREGLTTTHWALVTGILGCLSIVLGAGAATAVGWLWREEILIRERPVGGRASKYSSNEKA